MASSTPWTKYDTNSTFSLNLRSIYNIAELTSIYNIAAELKRTETALTLSAVIARTAGAPGSRDGGPRACLELSLLALVPPAPAAEERGERDEGDQHRGRRDAGHHRRSPPVAAVAVGTATGLICLEGRGGERSCGISGFYVCFVSSRVRLSR